MFFVTVMMVAARFELISVFPLFKIRRFMSGEAKEHVKIGYYDNTKFATDFQSFKYFCMDFESAQ